MNNRSMRISLLLIILVFFTCSLTAQNYTRDVGIRVGDYFTASFRTHQDDRQALEAMVFIGRHGATIGVLKEYFQPALGHVSDNLYFQYGMGMHIGFRYIDRYRILNRVYRLDEYRFAPVFGVDGLIGLEYRFPDLPFLIGVDIKPYFEYSTIQIFSIYLQSAGISIKYRF
jgi:hypothetical protein